MRFGWTDEEKEKYFIKAEQQIEAAGFTDFLKIDKTSFGVQGQKMKVMLSRLVDTFFSRTSWTMLLYAENHSISVA